MKILNYAFAIIFAVIALGAFCGVMVGRFYLAILFVLAAMLALITFPKRKLDDTQN